MLSRVINLAAVSLTAVLMVILMVVTFTDEGSADECPVSSAIFIGDTAPCSGVLFPHGWALQAVQCMDVDLPMWKTKTEVCHLTLHTKAAEWGRMETSYKAQVSELEALTRSVAGIEKPWFESRWVWFALGSVVTGSLILVVR